MTVIGLNSFALGPLAFMHFDFTVSLPFFTDLVVSGEDVVPLRSDQAVGEAGSLSVDSSPQLGSSLRVRRRRHRRRHHPISSSSPPTTSSVNDGNDQADSSVPLPPCNCLQHRCWWRQVVMRWGDSQFLNLPVGASIPPPVRRPIAIVSPMIPQPSSPMPRPRYPLRPPMIPVYRLPTAWPRHAHQLIQQPFVSIPHHPNFSFPNADYDSDTDSLLELETAIFHSLNEFD
jgi:hypothetical protein